MRPPVGPGRGRRLGTVAVLSLALLATGRHARADGPRPEDRAFVEVVAERANPYVGEPFVLRLRFGVDAAYFETNAVAPFRQPVDVPVEVTFPWATEPADAVALPELAPEGTVPPQHRSFSLDGREAQGVLGVRVVREGRIFTVVEVARRYRIDRAGDRAIPRPTLRFVHASRFEDDLLRGRAPVDPSDVVVRGAPLTVRVQALPVEGRPAAFPGAVGRFTLAASADRATVAAGAPFHLTLRLAGEGDLPSVELPRLDALPGFHVYGVLDDRGLRTRTVVFELAPLAAAVAEVPPLSLDFLDPGPPAAYRSARTAPIPLAVTPPVHAPAANPHDEPDRTGSPFRTGGLAAVLAALAALGAAVWFLVRRRAARLAAAAADPVRARIRGAAAAFRAGALRPDTDVADAFAEYLAAHLRCGLAAVISPDLARRLSAVGVSPQLAARAAATLESLVAARYGGGSAATTDGLPALVEELELSFQRGPHAQGAPAPVSGATGPRP